MTPEGTRLRLDAATLLAPRTLAVLLPTSLVTSVLTRAPDDLQSTLGWVGVNLASLAVTGLWVVVLLVLLADGPQRLGLRPEVGLLLAVTVGASVGLTKGLSTSLFGWTAGLLDDPFAPAELTRAVSATLQGALLLPSIGLVAAGLGRLRAEYRRLVQERARRTLLAGGGAQGEHDARIVRFVAEARARIDAAVDPTVVTVLEELVEQRLRPLTRRLWGGGDVATDFTLRSLLRAALHVDALPAVPVAVGFGVVDLLFRGGDVPVGTSLVASGAKAAAVLAVFVVAGRLRPRDRRFDLAHLLGTLTVTAVLIVLLEGALVRPNPSELTLSVGVVLALVTLAGFTLLASAVRVALRTRVAVRAELERLLAGDVDEAAEVVSRRLRDREVADRLHSGLQNRLIAAARRIDASGGAPDVVRGEVAAVGRMLDTVVAELDAPEGDAHVRLTELVDRWAGFVDVDVDVDDALAVLPAAERDGVVRAVTEAVNNAVRHGRAERVVVRAHVSAGAVELEAVDDGLGPVDRPPGLGSRLFDTLTGGGWTLTARPDGGSRLRLPLRPG